VIHDEPIHLHSGRRDRAPGLLSIYQRDTALIEVWIHSAQVCESELVSLDKDTHVTGLGAAHKEDGCSMSAKALSESQAPHDVSGTEGNRCVGAKDDVHSSQLNSNA